MLNSEKKVTFELINKDKSECERGMTNPLKINNSSDKIADMVKMVLDNELPSLKHNSLLHDLVLYTVLEKMNTVQNVENALSYIKGSGVKEVRDVYFKNGEFHDKCSL